MPFNGLLLPDVSCSDLKVYVANINTPLGSTAVGSCAGGISELPSTEETLLLVICCIILLHMIQN